MKKFGSRRLTGKPARGVFTASDTTTEDLSKYSVDKNGFHALLDTGATKYVMGLPKAQRMAKAIGTKLNLIPSRRRFRFDITPHNYFGITTVNIPTPGGVMSLTVDVVGEDVPFLFGLDDMDRHRVQPLTVQNKLQRVDKDRDGVHCVLDLVRAGGHVLLPFVPIRNEFVSFYTRHQMERLHRSLYYPSAEKMLSLLQRADPANLDGETRRLLDEIS